MKLRGNMVKKGRILPSREKRGNRTTQRENHREQQTTQGRATEKKNGAHCSGGKREKTSPFGKEGAKKTKTTGHAQHQE